jgi:hypothetical protein
MVEQARLREYIYYSDRKIVSFAQQLRVSGWRRALDRIEEAGVGGPEATGAKVKTRPPEPTPILQLLQRVWKQLEFEVLPVKEGRSTVAEPFWEAPRHVLIGSPIFVAFR